MADSRWSLIGTPFLLLRFYKTAAGKAMMDRLILWMPVFGSLCRKLDTSRFARTLSMLLDAGVDVGTLDRPDRRRDQHDADPPGRPRRREKVMQGKELSVTLAPSRQFSPDVIAMLAVGRGDRQDPREPEPPGRRLRGAGLGHGQEPGPPGPAAGHPVLGGIVLFIILAVFLPYIQMITGLAGP